MYAYYALHKYRQNAFIPFSSRNQLTTQCLKPRPDTTSTRYHPVDSGRLSVFAAAFRTLQACWAADSGLAATSPLTPARGRQPSVGKDGETGWPLTWPPDDRRSTTSPWAPAAGRKRPTTSRCPLPTAVFTDRTQYSPTGRSIHR